MYYAKLLIGEELILVTVCDFLNGPEHKTVVSSIVRCYSNSRKKQGEGYFVETFSCCFFSFICI